MFRYTLKPFESWVMKNIAYFHCRDVSRRIHTNKTSLLKSSLNNLPFSFNEDLSRFTSPICSSSLDKLMKDVLETIQDKNKNEHEFLQTINETFFSLKPVFRKEPKLIEIFKVLAEPERSLVFRVPWMNKNGIQCFNRGFRIQHSSALGPYKGGLRFHPTVTHSIMKFLAFEQTFKNSLTGLQLGGAKGGSDFNPKNKTSSEIMNFCQSFMTELSKHMGSQWDIPAGDINVGPQEIGYLFGQYKRLQNKFDGSLTGKGIEFGGSYIRPESTGYGAVFFAQHWCDDHNVQLKGARCALSGSGNVALYAAQKLLALGAIPITLSDSNGFVYEPNGFNEETLNKVMHLKFNLKKRLEDYAKESCTAIYYGHEKPWNLKTCITMAFPCATQNELLEKDVCQLVESGCQVIVEGANMPTSYDGVAKIKELGIGFCPAKATNMGGVAVSGLEMAQNSMRTTWHSEKVEQELYRIMLNSYTNSKKAAQLFLNNPSDLLTGANIFSFLRIATALIQQGCV